WLLPVVGSNSVAVLVQFKNDSSMSKPFLP
ncbi:hypothetical protein A2U01_0097019, partial [Trifolium medium]|nr:hypothetical protein [Trifolium medium]